jgi:uncharacterized peroxidase-related enzyme
MTYLATTGLPVIEEDEATGEVAEIYDEIKRELQLPVVPNYLKAVSASPEILAFVWQIYSTYDRATTLPQSLKAMISYTIATRGNCTYCSASHELTCRTLGIDEDTLDFLIEDLDHVNPQRIRAIIEFTLKAAKHPQELVRGDYDKLREQGVTEEEIVELVLIAGFSVMSDVLADALQIEVDGIVSEALEQLR